MTVFVAILLALASIAIIAYPFFSKRDGEVVGSSLDIAAEQSVREQCVEEERAFSALREAEFDRELGNIAEEEYQKVKGQIHVKGSFNRGAKGSEQEHSKPSKGVDAEIEREIRKLRHKGAKHDESKVKYCPECGARQQHGAKFCSRCGAKQPKGES